MSSDHYVLKISGSFIDPTTNSSLIKDYVNILTNCKKIIGVVVGGGNIARKYISILRDDVSKFERDYIGIKAAQLNALSLAISIKYSGREVLLPIPTNWDEVYRNNNGKLVVLGGMEPGQSTDAVTFKLAELLNVKNVIVLTKVDGVYTKDPNKYPDAEFIPELTYDNLKKLLDKNNYEPGKYFLLDDIAILLARRSKIKTYVLNGNYPQNIIKLINGETEGIKYSVIFP